MRWQPKHFLAFLLFIFCLLTYYGSNRSAARERSPRNVKYLPKLSVSFTKLSKLAQVVYGMRDNREGNMGHASARFLVIAQKNLRFHCRFPSGKEVVAKNYEFSENHNMLYGVFYINCEIPKDEPFFKTIEMSEESEANWVQVPVVYNIQDEKQPMDYEFDYGICVPVLFGSKYSAYNLIEFMELNSLMGGQKVTIYTNGAPLNSDLKEVFNYYSEQGILQEVEFIIPQNYMELWYHGQLAAISDCLVRHTSVARYVAFHDLDEFLVPMEETNVVDVLERRLKGNVGSLRVPTQYMFNNQGDQPGLLTLQAFDHQPAADPIFTKCVLRPEMVFEQGIHHTSRVIQDNYESPHAKESDLKLFHYKQRNGGGRTTRIADIYGEQLRENYNLVVKYLRLKANGLSDKYL